MPPFDPLAQNAGGSGAPNTQDAFKAIPRRAWVLPRANRFASGPLSMLLLLPLALMLTLFCLAPLAWVLTLSVSTPNGFGGDHFREIFSSPFYRRAFGNSLVIAGGSSLIGLVIAWLGAASLRRLPGWLRDTVVALSNMTSNLTGVPLAFAFIILFGTNGALTLLLRQWGWVEDVGLYSRQGLMLIYTYFQIPLGLLLLYPAFDALDDDWPQAAALLGARPWQYWWHVGLPVLAPAVLGTLILLFANALGAYATAYALTGGNFNLVTIRIASLVAGDLFLEPQRASALSVLLILLLALVTAASRCLLANKHAHAR